MSLLDHEVSPICLLHGAPRRIRVPPIGADTTTDVKLPAIMVLLSIQALLQLLSKLRSYVRCLCVKLSNERRVLELFRMP